MPENRPTFCIQNIKKINYDFLTLLKKIIEKIPDIYILLKKDLLQKNNIEKILKFTNGKDNICFCPQINTFTFHCLIYHSTLVLDPYPFGGCNSSLEAFSLSKVVVTIQSNFYLEDLLMVFIKKWEYLMQR